MNHSLRARLFRLLAITDTNTGFRVAAVLGMVKLVAAIICSCALSFVGAVGGKCSLLLGIACQAVVVFYVAGLLTDVPRPDYSNESKEALTGNQPTASKSAAAMIYLSGVGWALGWNPQHYLLTPGRFPLRVITCCTPLAMTFHFCESAR